MLLPSFENPLAEIHAVWIFLNTKKYLSFGSSADVYKKRHSEASIEFDLVCI